jgi:Na+-transporting NADH:ubiquinone oxidoreductase subunit NqrE
MSEVRNIDPFSLIILILSIIAIITEIIGPFASFFYGSYGYRYSCLDCEYSTPVDLILQYLILILFVIQIIITLNELLPNKFIPKDVTKYGMHLAILTWIFAIIGLASFGITYSSFEWWPELGFYGTVVGGVLNTILFFLQQRNK